MKKLVITGDVHSGWKSVAELIGAEGDNTAAVWADAAIINELDAWRKKQPELRFLLVYSSPEHMLAAAMGSEPDLVNKVDELLAAWEKSTLAAVNFFQQNRDVAALVNANTLYEKGEELLSLCQKLADIEPQKSDGSSAGNDENRKAQPPFSLMANLALLIPQRERLYQLYDNIQSTASIPGVDLEHSGNPVARGKGLAIAAVEEYRKNLQQAPLAPPEDPQGKAEWQEKLTEAEQENELALLQIHQLQEELEHYFIAYKESKEELESYTQAYQNTKQQLTLSEQDKRQARQHLQQLHHQLSRKPQRLARAASCEALGTYGDSGYCDITVCLHDFTYGMGEQLEKLVCKVVQKSGRLGLEFRHKDNPGHEECLTWPADMTDDHGPYLLYMPSPGEEQQARQHQLRGELLTRDRQLITGAAFAISDCFMRGDVDTELLSREQQRQWRSNAEALAQQMQAEADYLTTDEIILREDFNSEGYRHLWLECANLQLGQQVFETFGFKLFRSGEGDLSLGMEFRDLEGGIPPFEAWPPQEKDDYGHISKIRIKPGAKATHLVSTDNFTAADQALVREVLARIPAVLDRLEAVSLADAEWEQIPAMVNKAIAWGEPLSWKGKLKNRLRRRRG